MKESIAVLNRGLNSESVLEAIRHKQVALPSIAAPYSTGTCTIKRSSVPWVGICSLGLTGHDEEKIMDLEMKEHVHKFG
jgi:hypothetical protein